MVDSNYLSIVLRKRKAKERGDKEGERETGREGERERGRCGETSEKPRFALMSDDTLDDIYIATSHDPYLPVLQYCVTYHRGFGM